METKHPFSSHGSAPFKCIDYRKNVFTVPGCYSKPGGTCDHCGTSIMHEYTIVSAEGNRFVVGSDCVRKTESPGLIREAAKVRDTAELENAKEFFEANVEKLRTHPHPKITTLTFLDWVNWMWSNSGKTGKMKALKEAQKIIGC